MNVLTRLKVTRNMDYHQQMADHYTALGEARKIVPEGEAAPENGRRTRAATTTPATPAPATASAVAPTPLHTEDEEYLATLHAEIATQLRDVLGTASPPLILGATPPVTRVTGSLPTGRKIH